MEKVVYTVKLDLTDNGIIETGWRIKQNDSGNISLNVKVVNNGVDYFDSSIVPEIAFKRSDGKSLISTMTASNGYYEYSIVGNELAVAGPVVMDVKLEDSEGRISTASCKFTCVEDTIGSDPEVPTENFSPVSELIEKAETSAAIAEASATEAKEYRDQAEAIVNNHWSGVQDKPFETLNPNDFRVRDGELSVIGGGGGGGTSDYDDLSHKPKINGVELSGNKTSADLGINIPNVPSWAMAENKPSYTASEVGALPDTTTHLSGDVPTTRKVNGKALSADITLNASDVNALPSTTTIPSALSDLTEDATHRTVTDAEKAKWNQGGGSSVNVVDNLDSTSSTDALSANMGHSLSESLNNKENEIKHFSSMEDYEAHKSEVADGDLFEIDDVEENNKSIITTTLGSLNAFTTIPYPNGFDANNTFILSIMAYNVESNGMWLVQPNYYGTDKLCDIYMSSEGIKIYISNTRLVGKTVKILLSK